MAAQKVNKDIDNQPVFVDIMLLNNYIFHQLMSQFWACLILHMDFVIHMEMLIVNLTNKIEEPHLTVNQRAVRDSFCKL